MFTDKVTIGSDCKNESSCSQIPNSDQHSICKTAVYHVTDRDMGTLQIKTLTIINITHN